MRGSVAYHMGRRRRVILRQIEVTKARLAKLEAALQSLDTEIRAHDPSIDPARYRLRTAPVPADWCARGEMSRTCLRVLREAARPMTALEVALVIMRMHGLNTGDTALCQVYRYRVKACLGLKSKAAAVRTIRASRGEVLWALAE